MEPRSLNQVSFLEHGRWALPDPADPGWGRIFSSELERPHTDRQNTGVGHSTGYQGTNGPQRGEEAKV